MTNIINLLDDAILNIQAEEDAEGFQKKHHYVRDIVMPVNGKTEGRCLRENWYTWKGFTPTNVEAKTLYLFETGYAIEDMVAKLLGYHKEKWLLERGRSVLIHPTQLKYAIKGKMDFVLRSKDVDGHGHRHTIIVELKSTHGSAVSNKKFGVKYTGVKIPHAMQANFYFQHCDETPLLFIDEVTAELMNTTPTLERQKYLEKTLQTRTDFPNVHPEELVLLYFSREDFNRVQFHAAEKKIPNIQMNDFRCLEVLEKHIEARTLPKRTYNNGKSLYPCKMCWFRKRCYDIDKN